MVISLVGTTGARASHTLTYIMCICLSVYMHAYILLQIHSPAINRMFAPSVNIQRMYTSWT